MVLFLYFIKKFTRNYVMQIEVVIEINVNITDYLLGAVGVPSICLTFKIVNC